jgi:signal transduction histidine kinase
VDDRLLDGSVALIVVWTVQGDILYSTNARLEGTHLPMTPELHRAIRGEIVSDLDATPELGAGGGGSEPLLEVYAPMNVNGRRPLVFEAYFSAASLNRDAAALRWQIVPLSVGALAVLELIQIPLVVSLGRRLSRQEAERSRFAKRSLRASDRERRSIAADVHDGPVQDLAGVSYALSALRASVPESQRLTVDRMVTAIRSAVVSLRRLMVEIYPPDLREGGLSSALHDLAGPLREQGLTVTVTDDSPEVPPVTAALLYRTAKEATTNVVRHAAAERVWIRLQQATLDGAPAMRLSVCDDGVGFPDPGDEPPPNGRAQDDGHLGLRLVRDRVLEAGGTVTLSNRPGGGAVVDAVIPLEHDGGEAPPG